MRELRLSRQWTLEQAAELLELESRQLQRVEAGRANVTLKTLEQLAEGFGKAIGELVDEERGASPTRGTATVAQAGSRRPNPVITPDSVLETIGSRVAELRLRAGMSQQALAKKAGLSLSLVRSVEAAQKSVTVRSLVLLAAALEASPEALLKE